MKHLRPVFLTFIMLTLIVGVVYPVIITAIGKSLFPFQAGGSLLISNGDIIGSELIGQNFTDPKYLWGRISATSDEPYNTLSSGGTNYASTNPALIAEVKARLTLLQPQLDTPVPIDLVTSSASGLDPEISIASGYFQISRIAKARGISVDEVQSIIDKNAKYPLWGILGEPRVNVLRVNLALDKINYEEQK